MPTPLSAVTYFPLVGSLPDWAAGNVTDAENNLVYGGQERGAVLRVRSFFTEGVTMLSVDLATGGARQLLKTTADRASGSEKSAKWVSAYVGELSRSKAPLAGVVSFAAPTTVTAADPQWTVDSDDDDAQIGRASCRERV